MKITRSVFIVSMFVLCVNTVVPSASGVEMTPQIRRLMTEKQEKMAALEKCEGKKKGFMIAGLSTIGLTAVGVAGNVILANKSSNLSDELDAKNKELQDKEKQLSNVEADFEKARAERAQAEKLRAEAEAEARAQAMAEAEAAQQRQERDMAACTANGGIYDINTNFCNPKKSTAVGVIGGKCENGKWTKSYAGDEICVDLDFQEVNCECKKEVKKSSTSKKTVQKDSPKACVPAKYGVTPEPECGCAQGLTIRKSENGTEYCGCQGDKTWSINTQQCVEKTRTDNVKQGLSDAVDWAVNAADWTVNAYEVVDCKFEEGCQWIKDRHDQAAAWVKAPYNKGKEKTRVFIENVGDFMGL